MVYHFQNPSDFMLKNYLTKAKTIAVVGLSDRQEIAAYQVSKIMQEAGYQIIPVNLKMQDRKYLGK